MLGAMLAQRQVRKAFDAMGRHDVEAVVAMFHDDGLFEFPGDTVVGGRFHGKEEIRAWFQRFFDRMPVIQFTVRHVSVAHIFAFGATNVLHVEWSLKVSDSVGHSYQLTGVTAFDAVGGKARTVKEYIFDQDVLASIWPRKHAPAHDAT